MTILRLRFPAGRYHATPHGRHVNEGVPEWPPSPYRLLRALFDAWQRKCPHLDKAAVESVLSALAQSPPRFHLPSGTATHTRSYLSANSFDPSDKNLVFDAFLAFDSDAACFLSWPDLKLTQSQRVTLAELLESLNYLGRSESWITAELAESAAGFECDPLELAAGYDGEPVPVACVASPDQYSGKRPWLDALTASSAEVIKQRASNPPLLRTVRYLRPSNSVETDPVGRPHRKDPDVEAVLLALDSVVLPLTTATIEIAEQIRKRLMGAHRQRMNGDGTRVSDLFSDKDVDGRKRLDHGHLYILPLSTDLRRIDRVLLISPLRAWRRDELDSVLGVRSLYQRDNRPDILCTLAWQGRRGKLSDVWTSALHVESATPFVPPRHWRRGRDFGEFLRDEIRRECRNHRLPEPIDISVEDRICNGFFECVEYRRNRKNDPVWPGYAIRLSFAEPVQAPFSIGYAAHFGLGMFRAAGS